MVADPSLSVRSQFQSRRARARTQPRERAIAAEQPDRVEERETLRATLDGRVERGHHLARLDPECLDRTLGDRALRSSSRTSRRARSPRRAPRGSVRSPRASPTSRRSIVNSSSSTKRKSICSTSCTVVRRAFLPDRERLDGRRRGRGDRRTVLAPRARRGRASSSSVEPADPLAVHPVELLGVEHRRRVRDPFEVELGDELVGREDLASVGRCPSEEREIVHERLGEVSRGRGTPRPRPRHGASRAWPGRRRGSAAGARTRVAARHRARRGARAPGAWCRCRSSPRITWVISMSMSSTALARKKIGDPSERTITKSWISDHSTSTSPRTRSWNRLTPVSGVRNRTTLARPSAAIAARSSAVRSRQCPS